MTEQPKRCRRWFRVPMVGSVRWRSGASVGEAKILDVSPGGAAFALPLPNAFQLGTNVTLDIELMPQVEWRVANDAKLTRITRGSNGMCHVGVEYAPSQTKDS